MVRIRTQFRDKSRARSIEERAGVMATNIWRIACNTLLNLENENYQTDTQAQRLEVLVEVTAFLLHCTDRMTYARLGEERAAFINTLAQQLVSLAADNMRDAMGEGEHRTHVIERLNARSGEYAEHPFDAEGPGFNMRRHLGHSVAAVMGPRDQYWLAEQVMEIEVPEAMESLAKALTAELPDSSSA